MTVGSRHVASTVAATVPFLLTVTVKTDQLCNCYCQSQ